VQPIAGPFGERSTGSPTGSPEMVIPDRGTPPGVDPGAEGPCSLTIDPDMLEQIVAHLRGALPLEGCGLIGAVRTDDGIEARLFIPGSNADRSAARFTMEPAEVIAAFKSFRALGLELGAIAHSHPASPAEPSPTDLREAYYPEALMLITSFSGDAPDIRAWRILPPGTTPRWRECPIHLRAVFGPD
jgi:proteasome lid subunit RPN8/RPN11